MALCLPPDKDRGQRKEYGKGPLEGTRLAMLEVEMKSSENELAGLFMTPIQAN